jgi:hypothetical protein
MRILCECAEAGTSTDSQTVTAQELAARTRETAWISVSIDVAEVGGVT